MARVTIYSIARDCGVSAATVSRAFSRPDLVRPDVRDRILARSRDLGYRPNQVARHLATGRTGMIGLLLPDITNPFFPPLVRAIQQAAAAADMSVLLADSEERPGAEPGLIARVKAQADGLIVASPRARSAALTEAVAQVPTVLINRRMRGLPSVICDYMPALARAGGHLLAHGHRRVALVRGPSASWAGQQRAGAVRAWAADAGVTLVDLGSYPATHAGGREAADALLATEATAAFAYDDLVACGILTGFAAHRWRIPERCSVVGCDDVLLARTVTPSLTTVAAPVTELGRSAVDLLVSRMAGRSVDDVTLPAHFVLRESTGPVA